jgi:hypothetical protein
MAGPAGAVAVPARRPRWGHGGDRRFRRGTRRMTPAGLMKPFCKSTTTRAGRVSSTALDPPVWWCRGLMLARRPVYTRPGGTIGRMTFRRLWSWLTRRRRRLLIAAGAALDPVKGGAAQAAGLVRVFLGDLVVGESVKDQRVTLGHEPAVLASPRAEGGQPGLPPGAQPMSMKQDARNANSGVASERR